jgi:tetratricopeptide (TPR) repeat protein
MTSIAVVRNGVLEVNEGQKKSEGNVISIAPSYGAPLAIITTAELAHGFSGGPALNNQRQVAGVAMAEVPSMENDGKELFKMQGILVPASAITSLAVGASQPLRDWTKARGVVASAAAEVVAGQIAAEQGDKAKGQQHFRKATKLDPNNFMAWFQLGGSLLGMGRDAEAMDALGKALALQPRIPEVLFGLGVLLQKQKQYPQAVESFESALRMNPNSDRTRFSLGMAYLVVEQSEKAKEQCRALKPMNQEASTYLSGLIQKWDAVGTPVADKVSRQMEPVLTLVKQAAKEGTLNKDVAVAAAGSLRPLLGLQFSKIDDQDTEAVLSCYLNTVSEIHRLTMTSQRINAVERLEIINVGIAGISQLLSSHGVTPTQAVSVKRITGDSIAKSLQAEVFMGSDLDSLMGSIPSVRCATLLREMGIYESTLQSTKMGKK